MTYKYYQLIDSFFDYLLFAFAPEKYYRRLEKRINLQLKINDILELKEGYFKKQQEVFDLQMQIAKINSECAQLQLECKQAKATLSDQANHIRHLERSLAESVPLSGSLA